MTSTGPHNADDGYRYDVDAIAHFDQRRAEAAEDLADCRLFVLATSDGDNVTVRCSGTVLNADEIHGIVWALMKELAKIDELADQD